MIREFIANIFTKAIFHKILNVLTKLKSGVGLCFSLHDLGEFFLRAWPIAEFLLVAVVVVWIPAIRLAGFLIGTCSLSKPFYLPKRNCKIIMWIAYWFCASATVLNLSAKIAVGYSLERLCVLIVANAFLLIMDYLETKELMKKLNEPTEKSQ